MNAFDKEFKRVLGFNYPERHIFLFKFGFPYDAWLQLLLCTIRLSEITSSMQARLSHADWAARSLSCLLTQRGNVPAPMPPTPHTSSFCFTDKRAIWQQDMTRARQSTPCFVLVQSWNGRHNQQAASTFDPAVIISGVLTSSAPVVVSQRSVKPCMTSCSVSPPSYCHRQAGPVSLLILHLIRLYVCYLYISYLLIHCGFLSFLWSSSCSSS